MTLDIYELINRIVDTKSLVLPDIYKRRDPREPGRAEKEMAEDKLARLVRKRFRTQKKIIENQLKWMLPLKQVGNWMDRIEGADISDPVTEAKMFSLFVGAMAHGAQIFGENIDFIIDYEQFNILAKRVARTYQTEWLAGLDKTTLDGLRSELQNFVEISGYTMADVMRGLPFEAHRVKRIATTEITRVYARANKIAGEQLIKELPDVRVIKTWFTNFDDIVCEICRPFDGVSILFADYFIHPVTGERYFNPEDSHIGCRCWDEVTTDILEEVELG